MTIPRAGPTYGEQMTQALLRLSHAVTGPIGFDNAVDAVGAAQARTRIYRTAVRIMTVCRTSLDFRPPAGLSGPERRVVDHLIAELSRTVAATRGVLTLPAVASTGHATGAHLGVAADSAGLAWDLLATGLTPEGEPAWPTGAWAVGVEARAVLADGLLLTRGMASLDGAIGPCMRTAAHERAVPVEAAASLRAVAEDCEAVAMVNVAASTAGSLHMASRLHGATGTGSTG